MSICKKIVKQLILFRILGIYYAYDTEEALGVVWHVFVGRGPHDDGGSAL
jgi:hypothetical protein